METKRQVKKVERERFGEKKGKVGDFLVFGFNCFVGVGEKGRWEVCPEWTNGYLSE